MAKLNLNQGSAPIPLSPFLCLFCPKDLPHRDAHSPHPIRIIPSIHGSLLISNSLSDVPGGPRHSDRNDHLKKRIFLAPSPQPVAPPVPWPFDLVPASPSARQDGDSDEFSTSRCTPSTLFAASPFPCPPSATALPRQKRISSPSEMLSGSGHQ